MALYGIYGKHTTEVCPWNNINTARRLQALADGGLASAAQEHHIDAILSQYHSALEHTFLWVVAYSTEFCHPIRRKVATQPTSKLPCSPSESCHPIRRKVAPDSGVKLPPPSERSDAACFYG